MNGMKHVIDRDLVMVFVDAIGESTVCVPAKRCVERTYTNIVSVIFLLMETPLGTVTGAAVRIGAGRMVQTTYIPAKDAERMSVRYSRIIKFALSNLIINESMNMGPEEEENEVYRGTGTCIVRSIDTISATT